MTGRMEEERGSMETGSVKVEKMGSGEIGKLGAGESLEMEELL